MPQKQAFWNTGIEEALSLRGSCLGASFGFFPDSLGVSRYVADCALNNEPVTGIGT